MDTPLAMSFTVQGKGRVGSGRGRERQWAQEPLYKMGK